MEKTERAGGRGKEDDPAVAIDALITVIGKAIARRFHETNRHTLGAQSLTKIAKRGRSAANRRRPTSVQDFDDTLSQQVDDDHGVSP